MPSLTMGKLVVMVVLIGIIFNISLSYIQEYAGGNQTGVYKNFSATYTQTNSNFTSKVYQPLQKNIGSGTNQSNTLAQSSSIFGFAFAFILNGFGSIVTSMVQFPALINVYLTTTLSAFTLTSGSTSTSWISLIVTGIQEIVTLFVFFQALSMWMKYPLW